MFRLAFAFLLCCVILHAQEPVETSTMRQVPDAPTPPQPPSEAVAAAEAAMAKSDWKAAENKLDPWIAAHPEDARALFDAGYVADAENRIEDATALYCKNDSCDVIFEVVVVVMVALALPVATSSPRWLRCHPRSGT